jgi:zinc transport system substrate-binding protein
MRLRNIALLTLAAVGCMVAVSGCGHHGDDWGKDPTKLRVMASFPPIYSLVANVAGDKAEVRSLLDSSEIHHYHASPHDSIRLHHANLFFINGLGLDDEFAGTLTSNADNPNLKVIEIGEDELIKPKLIEMQKGHSHAGHQHHGKNDPHIWLGVPEAILMVKVIRDKMVEAENKRAEADPANKEIYEKNAEAYKTNAEAYIAKLNKELLEFGKNEFKSKKEKKFVTFHDSLGYFARAFDLQIFGTIQPFAGEDASAGRLAKLADDCKKDGVRVIVVEPGQSANSEANALFEELKKKDVKDVAKVEIDMLESAPRGQLTPDYYEKKMRKNIEDLAKALK